MNRIILGTAQFGSNYGINNQHGELRNEQIFQILEYAFDAGIRKIDTAGTYGRAEEAVGLFHKSLRKRFEIDTKFSGNLNLSASEQLSQSTKQLGVPVIQTYYFHSFRDIENIPNLLEEACRLKAEKAVKNIGVSVYSNEDFAKALTYDEIDSIQFPFNMLDNHSKRGPMLELAKLRGKRTIARSLFLQGLFFKELDAFPIVLEPLIKYVEKLQYLSKKYAVGMNELALSYVRAQENIDFVIIGVESLAQLKSNIVKMNRAIDEGLKREIDRIDVAEKNLLYPYNWI